MKQGKVYYLKVEFERCTVTLELNGFPLLSLESIARPLLWSLPINPLLCGKDNAVEVVIRSSDPDDPHFDGYGACRFEGLVSRYEAGGVAEPDGGEMVTVLKVPKPVWDAGGPTLRFGAHFSSEDAPSFESDVRQATVCDDPQLLLDYAMALRGMLQRRDVDGLLAEFEPKIAAYARAYYVSVETIREEIRGSLEVINTRGPVVDFGQQDVAVNPCCGGRLWEISVPGRGPLLASHPDAGGSVREIPVYAGLVDGRMRIAR